MNLTHHSFILFTLDDGTIKHIPQTNYVALVRKELVMQEFAGKRLHVADLYVALDEGVAPKIDNETYSYLYFDEDGYADPHHGGFSIKENRAFYDRALNSPYSNIGDDPEVQKIRKEIGDDFSWRPTEEERKRMLEFICISCA
jgi:hypothetical protein